MGNDHDRELSRERVRRYRLRKKIREAEARGEPVPAELAAAATASGRQGRQPKPLAAYLAHQPSADDLLDRSDGGGAESLAADRARLRAAFNSVHAELERFDGEYARACERAQMVLPWPEGINLRRGEYFHLLAQLENLDGHRYHHLGPRSPDEHFMGPLALWVPGNRLVYLGHSRHADGVVCRWRLDAFAPACAWSPGRGAPADTTVYLEAEPGRQAMEGELVINAGEGRPQTRTAHATRLLLSQALFNRLEIRADTEAPGLETELAELLRDSAGAALWLFAEKDQARAAELLGLAAIAIETNGTYLLGEEAEAGGEATVAEAESGGDGG